ncbi:MAG: polysaccharide deacetylase family protein [Deltaproteobacteria bacterium]|nr:polysaccharide deacetylase family protein [Deltaproteobacteria bacterium]MCW5808124.1 polysaccharide deacetylase family protein [Deltaproteobacteria bacterium]
MTIRAALACIGMAIGLGAPLSSTATAKGWPTPAAGESASGDVELLLTFDDGPNPETTPKVLDLLKERKLHAIFFMVGEMVDPKKTKKAAAIVQRILDEGHVIATHTWRHRDLCKIKADDAAAEIDHGRELIEKASGFRTAWFRTPGGVRCTRLEEMLAERHLAHFHWDIDSQEWKKDRTVEKVVKMITNDIARAQSRSVVLMHDTKKIVVQALPEILKFVDEENIRRAKSNKKRIRFLEPSVLAREQLTPGLAAWVAEATANLRELPRMLATILP